MAKNICDTCCFCHLCVCDGGCDSYAPVSEEIEDSLISELISNGRAEYLEAWYSYINED